MRRYRVPSVGEGDLLACPPPLRHARPLTIPVLFAVLMGAASPCLAITQGPRLNFFDRVNPVPRPYSSRLDVTTSTTIYFEVVVPDSNGDAGKVDTNSITATLTPEGGAPVPMLLANQVFASGFSGKIIPGIDSGSDPEFEPENQRAMISFTCSSRNE